MENNARAAGMVLKIEELQDWLKLQLSALLRLEASQIDIYKPFEEYGLTSRDAVLLSGDLEILLGQELSPTLLWEYPTIEQVARRFGSMPEITPSIPRPALHPVTPSVPLAIIGLSCRFPQAKNAQDFWQLLRNGVDAITELPEGRWERNVSDISSLSSGSWGGFLDQVDYFDPHFFHLSPRETIQMDPQQRLLLEVAWEALEDAGQANKDLRGSRTGVFLGMSHSDYAHLQLQQKESISAYTGTGSALSIAANRLSYFLDLKGPSLVVDTACSSSLVALHLACQSLRSGEVDMALVGGVNLLLSPAFSLAFSQAGMLAADGRCKTFDRQADGYVRGEGCGMIVLKRLPDAVAHQDRVMAQIRGTAVNQDGRSNGLTAPQGKAQQEVIQTALDNAGITANQLQYIEAHGTGTPLGDPIEIEALGKVLHQRDAQLPPCIVGSVKTNIGHLEAAAGIAGIIKVVLALLHQEIPPHLHLKKLNEYIDLATTPLTIPTQLTPWPAGQQTRIAGVSSFGFGGTNAHVILEEAPPNHVLQTVSVQERPVHLLTLTAHSEKSLQQIASNYADYIQTNPDINLADICFTSNVGRSHFDHRLAVIVQSNEELKQELHAFAASAHKDENRFRTAHVQTQTVSSIAFLYTGQGSQYMMMGRQLYDTQPVFRQTMDRCADILRTSLEKPLLSILYDTNAINAALIHETAYTQPALFAIECALTELWKSWGIFPQAVLGHSVGEYAAAWAAGILSLEEGLQLVAKRGRLIQSLPKDGQMLTVFADEEQIARVITPYQKHISVAAINGPAHIVLSGRQDAMQKVQNELEALNIKTTQLRTSHAFHSLLMEPILDTFERIASSISFNAPRIPFISTVFGKAKSREELGACYWRDQLSAPVQFAQGMQTLSEQGYTVFLEVGPTSSLLNMGRRCLPALEAQWLPSLKQHQPDWQVLLNSLTTLYLQGREIQWSDFDAGYHRQRLSLPTYPFTRQRYWLPRKETLRESTSGLDLHPYKTLRHPSYTDKAESGNSPFMEQEYASRTTVQDAVLVADRLTIDAIQQNVRAVVARLLQTKEDMVELSTPFLEMGADSLVLIDAIRTIEKTFGVKISMRQLFEDCTNLEALAKYIYQHQPHALSTSTPTFTQSIDTSPQLSRVSMSSQTTTQPAVRSQSAESAEHSSPPSEMIERIMVEQLHVFSHLASQQLAIFGSGQTGIPPSLPLRPEEGQNDQLVKERITEKLSALPSLQSPIPAQPGTARGSLNSAQQAYLDTFIPHYIQRTPKSRLLTQQSRSVLADNRASAGFRPSIKEMLYPIIADRSQDANIYDVDGNKYIDISMGFGVNLFGHNPPFVIDALKEQLEQGMQLGPQTSLAGEVARLISELTGMERVTFCNSGTEAVMTALRLARAATKRSKIAMFQGSYHGSFDGVLASHPPGTDEGPVPAAPGVLPHMIEDIIILPYGEQQALETIHAHVHELAAVLVEPVQSRHPHIQPESFLHRLREITQQEGIALIFDEMITGFRIHQGGAQAFFGIQADIATYGKIVGGGMPIGVVAGKPFYMDRIDGGKWQYGDSSHPVTETTFFAGTFCKHPLAMATARATLHAIKEGGPELYERLNQHTIQMVHTLNAFFAAETVPIHVASFGSLFRFQFHGNMDLFFFHLLAKGIYIWEGRNCFLSTAHTDEDINSIIRAVKATIRDLQQSGFLPSVTSEINSKRDAASTALPSEGHTQPQEQEIITIPLTEAQRQLWTLAQVDENGARAYIECVALELQGSIDLALLDQAQQIVVKRHDALRTLIDETGETQHCIPSLTVALHYQDFSPVLKQEAQVTRWLQDESQRPFDLTKGPLLRISLLKLAEQRSLLVLTAHHIIIDGESIGLLLQEMSNCYRDLLRGVTPPATTPTQFRAYVEALEQQRLAQDAKTEHWLKQFAPPLPLLELPTDQPRPPVKTYWGARQSLTIDSTLYQLLKTVSKKQACTLFTTLLACYKSLIYRWTNQSDIVIGVPGAGRSFTGGEQVIGYCANIMPIRSSVHADICFSDYLATVKDRLIEAHEHEMYPFALLMRQLPTQRDASFSPFITTTFNLDRSVAVAPLFGIQAKLVPVPCQYVKFDLSLNCIEQGDTLIVDCDYNTDLFADETIKRLLHQYTTVLESVAVDLGQRMCQISLLDTAETTRILHTWNDTATEYPGSKCIHHLFEEQAERVPENTAVVFEGQSLTYRALNQRANQLAHVLQKAGVGPDVLVGICMERSLEMVIALLSVLKAGGAYVPLDLAYPQPRIASILEEIQAPVLLTQQRLLNRIPSTIEHVICLDDNEKVILQYPQSSPPQRCTADNLAYVLYTSGSTGHPKGVMISHRNLTNYLNWSKDAYNMSQGTGSLVQSSLSFDFTVTTLLAPLLVGQRIVLLSEESINTLQTVLKAQEDISLLKLTPSYLKVFHQFPVLLESLQRVRVLILGGEALSYEHLEPASKYTSHCRLINEYGPTETVVGCCVYEVPSEDIVSTGIVPIGKPIANTQLYVLDTYGKPVPIGIPGELYIGGVGVARGYLHRPELTAEKFIPHPYSEEPGARLYRTGDLARYRDDGTIEFLGRIDDNQVKIRGFRIELDEVETTIRRHPAVFDCVVMARQDTPNEKHLVAYIVPQERAQLPSNEELRQFIGEHLPHYMLPAFFIPMESLPLTTNGKIDKSALPAPGALTERSTVGFVAARTSQEQTLAKIWAEVLGIPQVGIYDDFFDLGGDSLLALRIVAKANAAGLALNAKYLFAHCTIAKLATMITSPIAEASMGQDIVQGSVYLTPIQHWFFEQALHEQHHWNQSLLLTTRHTLVIPALEQAFHYLVHTHDAFRLRFTSIDMGWQQYYSDSEEGLLTFSSVDLSEMDEEQKKLLMEKRANAEQRALSLTDGPLVRAVFFDLGSQQANKLLIVIHHLIIDGASWHILLEDLQLAYEQAVQQRPLQLPAKTTSFQDWSARLSAYAQTDRVKQQAEYWQQIQASRSLALPIDKQGKDNLVASEKKLTVELTHDETSELLYQLPKVYHAYVDEVLLSALWLTITHWTGDNRLYIDLEGHGREVLFPEVDLSRTIGWFTTLFPVSLVAEKGNNTIAILSAIKAQLRTIHSHGINYGLLRYLCQENLLGEAVHADIIFNYMGHMSNNATEKALFSLSLEERGTERSPLGQRCHLIEINSFVIEGQLYLEWAYSENFHHYRTVKRLAQNFLSHLRAILAESKLPSRTKRYLPSDFPEAGLDEQELHNLLSQLG